MLLDLNMSSLDKFKMSALDLGSNPKNKKESIENEALEYFAREEEIRTRELYEFIDDFVQSPEYVDYIDKKRSIIKPCATTQYDLNDIIVESGKNDEMEKYPLTQERKKIYAFKQNFEKYAANQIALQKIKKQKQSIQIIKSKIQEARRFFECTWESKDREKEKSEQFILQKYSAKFGIDLRQLSKNIHLKLLERFKRCHHMMALRQRRREKNICRIIEKLVAEYKLKKEPTDNKKQLPVKTREIVIEGLEIVGTKMQLIDREKLQLAELQEPVKAEEIIEKTDDKPLKTAKSSVKKEKPVKKEKSGGKKEKQQKAQKSTKVKKTKETKEVKTEDKFQLPTIPILNKRQKILPENIDNIVDIIEEFREFENEMENRDIFAMEHSYILGDAGIKSKPEIILFQNFDQERTYYKTICITNVTPKIRKIRFLKFIFPDHYDDVAFDVEHFGIKKLYTGCNVKFRVIFEPYDTFKPYKGKMVFLSYDVHLCEYRQFEIDVQCVPKYSELMIYPEEVQFGTIPVWKAKDCELFKIMKFQNKGTNACTLYIRKQFDPLGLEALLDEDDKENISPKDSNTLFQDVQDILDECLKNVENNFQFETSFFYLNKYEERRVKVLFKNASYIGSYFEKYTVDVYERGRSACLESVGCQTVCFYAETTGHFISTSPEVLDFGICVINSCYQINFELINDSSHSQAISIRMPSNLTDFVQSDVAMVYMSPKSSRTIFLKLCPKETIIGDSCIYFDKNNSILEFPISLKIVSKLYQDYPPVKVAVYAILTNFEDLTISNNQTTHLSNFLGTLLLDMGECSIYETIWTEIALTNNTDVTQVCGFTDVPRAITILPHFGFCKLYPGQRKKFKLYLSPEIKDFPSYPIGSLRNSNYFFKLKLETIASKGQINYEISPKKLKSSLDLMLKQLTMNDNDLYNSMIGFVSTIKDHFNLSSGSMLNKAMYINSRACSLLVEKALSRQDEIVTNVGDHINGLKALCIVLKRLAYPCRLADLKKFFGMSSQSLPQVIRTMDIMVAEKGGLLTNLNNLLWLNREKMDSHAQGEHIYQQLEEKAVFGEDKFVLYGDQGYGLMELVLIP